MKSNGASADSEKVNILKGPRQTIKKRPISLLYINFIFK